MILALSDVKVLAAEADRSSLVLRTQWQKKRKLWKLSSDLHGGPWHRCSQKVKGHRGACGASGGEVVALPKGVCFGRNETSQN